MNKEKTIKRVLKATWEKILEQARAWNKAHKDKKYRKEHPEDQYGIVDVIQTLDGKITLLTEEEVKGGR